MNELLWFDSHCHFDFSVFDDKRAAHWTWLQSLGLAGLFIAGVERTLGEKLPALCQDKPWFYSLGLHPYFIERHQNKDLDWLETMLRQDHKVIALGETGLDMPKAQTTHNLPAQWHYFSAQAQLAKRYQKPLVLHIRGAHDEALAYLRQIGFSQGGTVHAFSGSEQQAKKWLDSGFKLGIGGAMTHSRAHKLRRCVQRLPLDAWLLETDSPDMKSAFWGPSAHSPAAIPLLAACLAALKNTTLADVATSQRQQLLQLWPTMTKAYQ